MQDTGYDIIDMLCESENDTRIQVTEEPGYSYRIKISIHYVDKGAVGRLAHLSQPKVLSVGKYDSSPYTSLDLTYPGFAGFIYDVYDTTT